MELKKIGALSLANIQAVFMAIIGLIMTIFNLIMVTLVNGNPELKTAIESQINMALTFSYWNFLIMPLESAILGFILGLIFAGLYNLIAKLTGGVKVELK